MKLLILIIIALGGAIALGMYALQDPGYVVFSVPWGGEPYTVSMPFALFVLFLLLGFAALYLLFNFMVGVFRTPKKVRKWRKGKQEDSAQTHTMKGFAGLIEGDWSNAESSLMTKLDHNNASLMNYLGAAYAAQQQGQLSRRNQHLQAALENHPKQELAIKLTRARMQVQAGEWGDARDQLEFLRLSAPKNVAAARLLGDVYRELKDWPALVSLMPALTKLKAFPEDELRAREKLALENHLEAPALLQGDGSKVDEAFKALPRKKKKDAAAVASYAKQLNKSGEGQRAEIVLRKALNSNWDPNLARLYGVTETNNVVDQIKLLESWGRNRQDDDNYKFAMARLLRRDDKLDQAKELLGQVVTSTGESAAIAELGDLLEQMGEQDSALMTYKQGLIALTGNAELAPAPMRSGSELVVLDSDEAIAVAENSLPVISESKPA